MRRAELGRAEGRSGSIWAGHGFQSGSRHVGEWVNWRKALVSETPESGAGCGVRGRHPGQFPAVLREEGGSDLGCKPNQGTLWQGRCHPPIAQLGLLRPSEGKDLAQKSHGPTVMEPGL